MTRYPYKIGERVRVALDTPDRHEHGEVAGYSRRGALVELDSGHTTYAASWRIGSVRCGLGDDCEA